MDWDMTKSIITAVLAISTIIATALVGLMFGSLRTLRDTANDLRARVGDLEKERAEDKAAVQTLVNENKLLKTMVTGKVEWVAVTDQLEEHHRQALAFWAEANDHLQHIEEKVGGLR